MRIRRVNDRVPNVQGEGLTLTAKGSQLPIRSKYRLSPSRPFDVRVDAAYEFTSHRMLKERC